MAAGDGVLLKFTAKAGLKRRRGEDADPGELSTSGVGHRTADGDSWLHHGVDDLALTGGQRDRRGQAFIRLVVVPVRRVAARVAALAEEPQLIGARRDLVDEIGAVVQGARDVRKLSTWAAEVDAQVGYWLALFVSYHAGNLRTGLHHPVNTARDLACRRTRGGCRGNVVTFVTALRLEQDLVAAGSQADDPVGAIDAGLGVA